MTVALAIQYCLAGITVGSIYGIVAIGFNVIYNTTGIINFAQGEFVVLGAMIAISLTAVMPLVPAIAAAVLATMLVGAAMELLCIRRARDPSVVHLIVITIGLSIILRDGMLEVWGERPRALPSFTGDESASIGFLGASLLPQTLWVLGICACVVAALGAFYKFTLTGRAMRAVAANRTAARLCGIHAQGMVTLSFVLSAGMGALAGCAISPIGMTQYWMGAPYAIKGFTAAIVGGLGSSAGAMGAGLLIGLLESFSIIVMRNAYQDAVSIAVLILVLVFRPTGLFGNRAARALREF